MKKFIFLLSIVQLMHAPDAPKPQQASSSTSSSSSSLIIPTIVTLASIPVLLMVANYFTGVFEDTYDSWFPTNRKVEAERRRQEIKELKRTCFTQNVKIFGDIDDRHLFYESLGKLITLSTAEKAVKDLASRVIKEEEKTIRTFGNDNEAQEKRAILDDYYKRNVTIISAL